MRYKVTAKPSTNAVSLSEAKKDLRINGNYADSTLLTMIAAAQDYVEGICGLHTTSRTTVIYMNSWPTRKTTLPISPIQSVSSLKYLDGDGNLQSVASSIYTLMDDEYEPRVYKKASQSWPNNLSDEYERIFLTVVSGYGDSANLTPPAVRYAIRFLINHWFTNRVPVVVGAVPISIPKTFDSIVRSIKRYRA